MQRPSNGTMTTKNFKLLIWFALIVGTVVASYYISHGQLKDSVRSVESKQEKQELKQEYIVKEIMNLRCEFEDYRKSARANDSVMLSILQEIKYRVDNKDTGG